MQKQLLGSTNLTGSDQAANFPGVQRKIVAHVFLRLVLLMKLAPFSLLGCDNPTTRGRSSVQPLCRTCITQCSGSLPTLSTTYPEAALQCNHYVTHVLRSAVEACPHYLQPTPRPLFSATTMSHMYYAVLWKLAHIIYNLPRGRSSVQPLCHTCITQCCGSLPTLSTTYPEAALQCNHYVAHVLRSAVEACPHYLQPTPFGWTLNEKSYVPITMDETPAALNLMELNMCSCGKN